MANMLVSFFSFSSYKLKTSNEVISNKFTFIVAMVR